MRLGKLLLKYNPGSASARNAYLLLVKTNFKGSAAIPWRAYKDKNSKAWKNLAKLWDRLGGNVKTLSLAIEQGMKKEMKRRKRKGSNYDGFDFYETDNFAPAIAAAALTALPIIAKVVADLKKSGVEVDESHVEGIEADAKKHVEDVIKSQGIKQNADGSYNLSKKQVGLPDDDSSKSGVIVVVVIAAIVLLIYKSNK